MFVKNIVFSRQFFLKYLNLLLNGYEIFSFSRKLLIGNIQRQQQQKLIILPLKPTVIMINKCYIRITYCIIVVVLCNVISLSMSIILKTFLINM